MGGLLARPWYGWVRPLFYGEAVANLAGGAVEGGEVCHSVSDIDYYRSVYICNTPTSQMVLSGTTREYSIARITLCLPAPNCNKQIDFRLLTMIRQNPSKQSGSMVERHKSKGGNLVYKHRCRANWTRLPVLRNEY